MNTVICNAIKANTLLEIRYSGFSRIIEPYAYGRDKDGDEILRCFQTSGGSQSGESKGWKLLKVREVYSIHLSDIKFITRPEYKQNDKAMEFIFCQIMKR